MNKYDDNIDIILHDKISNIENPKLTEIDISNIINKAKKIKKTKILKNFAVFFVFLIISMSVIILKNYILNNNYAINNKFANINNDVVINNNYEKPIAKLYEENNNVKSKEIKTIIYNLNDSNLAFDSTSAVCFAIDPNNVYVPIENVSKIYVLKVEQILGYSFTMQKPITRLKCTVLDTLKGEKCDNIQIIINGGIFSIFELENSDLKYSLDEEYKNLNDNEKKNTFVRLISNASYNKKLAEPIVGNCYIVSLNNNNEVIENCDYPFLEFDFNNKLYKNGDVWDKFNF